MGTSAKVMARGEFECRAHARLASGVASARNVHRIHKGNQGGIIPPFADVCIDVDYCSRSHIAYLIGRYGVH